MPTTLNNSVEMETLYVHVASGQTTSFGAAAPVSRPIPQPDFLPAGGPLQTATLDKTCRRHDGQGPRYWGGEEYPVAVYVHSSSSGGVTTYPATVGNGYPTAVTGQLILSDGGAVLGVGLPHSRQKVDGQLSEVRFANTLVAPVTGSMGTRIRSVLGDPELKNKLFLASRSQTYQNVFHDRRFDDGVYIIDNQDVSYNYTITGTRLFDGGAVGGSGVGGYTNFKFEYDYLLMPIQMDPGDEMQSPHGNEQPGMVQTVFHSTYLQHRPNIVPFPAPPEPNVVMTDDEPPNQDWRVFPILFKKHFVCRLPVWAIVHKQEHVHTGGSFGTYTPDYQATFAIS